MKSQQQLQGTMEAALEHAQTHATKCQDKPAVHRHIPAREGTPPKLKINSRCEAAALTMAAGEGGLQHWPNHPTSMPTSILNARRIVSCCHGACGAARTLRAPRMPAAIPTTDKNALRPRRPGVHELPSAPTVRRYTAANLPDRPSNRNSHPTGAFTAPSWPHPGGPRRSR